MPLFLKLLPLLLKLKDLTALVREQFPGGKPFYYAKRFWGAVVTIIFMVAAYFGVDKELIGMTPTQLTSNLHSLATSIGAIGGAIYGVVMTLKGVTDAAKRKKAGIE
jgi:hypothetical protein